MTKERLNIVKCPDGTYSGHTVNLPLVMQGDDLEEIKKNAKQMAGEWIRHLQNIFSQDDPFDVKQFTQEEYVKNHH